MRVIICGAGIAGLSLAVLLGRAGWDVLLLDKARSLRDQGYMLDFVGSGYDAAERMDVLSALERKQYRISGVSWLTSSGRRRSRLSYDVFRKLHHGRFLNLMRGDLERTLYEALPTTVQVRFGTSIQHIAEHQDEIDLTLTTGEQEMADLLVGADGVHSLVRSLVFGPEDQFARYLGFHTASYIYSDPDAERKLGNEIRIVSVPGRQAGLYPIRGGKVASFFVHRAPSDKHPRSPADELKRVYGDLDWRVPGILAAASELDDIYYDQLAQIELPHWTRGRVTLLGDACYAVTLLAGQGASMAMGGAYVLARALQLHGTIEDALAAYEKKLAPAMKSKQASGREAADFVVPPDGLRQLTRDVAVTAAGFPGAARLLRRQLVAGTKSVVGSDV